MAVAIWQSREFLASAWTGIAPGHVAVAICLWTATHFVSPCASMLILGRARPIGYRSALAVHALRLPAKYLPGGIWHMVGRVNDLHGMGHERRSLVEFVVMENLVAAGFALGTGASLLLLSGETPWRGLLAVVAGLAFTGLALVPWIARFVGGLELTFPPARYGRLLAVTLAFWTLASAAFVVFLSGFGPAVIQAGVSAKIGTYLFSWGAGFIAFFAPQGVGVFEFVAGTLLDGRIALAQAVALMASFRIIVLAGDFVAWGVVLVFFRERAAR
jgi:hypothetical protein